MVGLSAHFELVDNKGFPHKAWDYDRKITKLVNPIQPNTKYKTYAIFQIGKDCKADTFNTVDSFQKVTTTKIK